MVKKAATLFEAVATSPDTGSEVDAAGGGTDAGVDSADVSTILEAALAAGSLTVADVSGSCPAMID
eukprot:scaffold305710_cov30-Tisochrysis_lutea.AAC.2